MKALFVGLGSIGQRHLRNLIEIYPQVELLAVRSTKNVPLLSKENKVIKNSSIQQQYELKEFGNLDDALSQNPDIVFITNPTSLHIEVALKAIKIGAFIFLEKPISNSYKGVKELIHLEKNFGSKKILVGYQFRFHPALKLIKELLSNDIIGKVIGAQCRNGEYMPGWHPYEDYRLSYASQRKLGGGALVTQIHDFDYAMWLFGYPSNVYSIGGHLSNLEIDVEDSVQVLMNCSDIPVSIQLDYLHWPPKREINITGEKGSIECDLNKLHVIHYDRVNNSNKKYDFIDFERNDLFLDEMKNFISFVEGRQEPVVSLSEASDSLRVALAAFESMNCKDKIELKWQ